MIKKKNIAIIGGGSAGSVVAWSLNSVHNVTLFETESRLGGHAYTETIQMNHQDIFVDIAVEYFSEKHAPNLFALLNHFRIETFVAPLSFGAAYDYQERYWSNVGINGLLWHKVHQECDKFQLQMHTIVHGNHKEIKQLTLGEFLTKEQYSSTFIYQILLPILSTFASSHASLLEYSLIFCAVSFSMGLLSFFHPTYWRKITTGISTYIQHIAQILKDKIHLNSKVTSVERNPNNPSVRLSNGAQYDFDEIIFATHADTALELISNPTDSEKEILSQFQYTPIECVLHTDENILIPKFGSKVYCQYNGIGLGEGHIHGSLTRIVKALPAYKTIPTSIMVTFDPKISIATDSVYTKKYFKIPKLRPQDMRNKKRICKLQGVKGTWFCGTDTSFTGQEGAVVSALVIANALGAQYPFTDISWAKAQYDMVKNMMGV